MEDLNIVTAIGHLSTVQYRFEEAFPRLEMPCDSVEVEASSADDCGFVGHRQLVRRRFVAFPLTWVPEEGSCGKEVDKYYEPG